MCIWRINEEYRMCEYCCYPHNCEAHPGAVAEVSAEAIINVMNDIVGEDIRQRCRRSILVWARSMVAYRLMMNGLKQQEAADLLGLNRTTMVYCRNQVQRMLDYPKLYIQELRMWKKFNEALSS